MICIAVVYVLTQAFVFLFPSYDLVTFAVGAGIPFLASLLLPLSIGNRVMLYASLGYFWALVDDAPVYLDSVITWPEVTRFHPAGPHIFLEILYHLLTAIFLFLGLREAVKGRATNTMKLAASSAMVALAFVLAYAQNLPFDSIQAIVENNWYQLDFVEHLSSALLYLAALKVAMMK